MEDDLWQRAFSLEDVPLFHCPKCLKARLALDDNGTYQEEPQHSKALHKNKDWDVEWVERRAAARLRCTDKKCGEVVCIVGEIVLRDVIDDDGEWYLQDALAPRAMFPAPPIIVIPSEVPESISAQLNSAFELFWMDHGAAANRLRTSVELLLDDFKIPREGKNKSGKVYRLTLEARIKAFQAIDSEHASTLDALRIVGNLGSHSDEVHRRPLLDAFAICEDALRELYGKHKQKMAELRKKIIAKSGNY